MKIMDPPATVSHARTPPSGKVTAGGARAGFSISEVEASLVWRDALADGGFSVDSVDMVGGRGKETKEG